MIGKILMTLSVSLLTITAQAEIVNSITPITPTTSLKWVAVKTLPPGAQVAILLGDPTKKMPFVAWVKLPANYTIPEHNHGIDENDTVISGTYYLGVGGQLKPTQAVALPAGSFVHIPAHAVHFGSTKEETIVQVSGMGPWGTSYTRKVVV